MQASKVFAVLVIVAFLSVFGTACASQPAPQPQPQPIIQEPSTPDVSGNWGSNIGHNYNFTQQGTRFTWYLEALHETGNGVINGNDVAVSWAGDAGNGSASCHIATASGTRATRIDCDNGVSFIR